MARIVPSQIRAYIETIFPEAVTQFRGEHQRCRYTADRAGVLSGLIDLVDVLPTDVLQMSAKKYGEYIAAVSYIRYTLRRWNTRGETGSLEAIPALTELNPVAVIYGALLDCSDELLVVDNQALVFIGEQEFRASVLRDMAAVDRALSGSEWKAATVLAGSVVEALLLWAIDQLDATVIDVAIETVRRQTEPPNDLNHPRNRWHLASFARVSHAAKTIRDDTLQQVLIVKEFRALIHPGRETRLGTRCDKGTAHAGVAAINLVERDIQEFIERQ